MKIANGYGKNLGILEKEIPSNVTPGVSLEVPLGGFLRVPLGCPPRVLPGILLEVSSGIRQEFLREFL